MFIFYYTLSSGIHVQNVQYFYIGKHMPWWFAASIPPSPTLCISPNVILAQLLHPSYHSLSTPPPTVLSVWCSPLWSMCSHYSTPTYKWEHAVFGFLFLCQFSENDGFQLYPCPCKGHKLVLFYGCIAFHGVDVPYFLCPVYHWWAFGLIPGLCYCKQCCNEDLCTCVLIVERFIVLWIYTQ